jgi:hypothetical protein
MSHLSDTIKIKKIKKIKTKLKQIIMIMSNWSITFRKINENKILINH